jgi:SAM-dependent methyltransferase
MMISSLFYRLAYRSGAPRWDSPEPRPEVTELARGRAPGRALDLGCGTGSDVIYLASVGWDAEGVDFAPGAIAIARSRAAASGSPARFTTGDVTRLREAGVTGRFDLVIDVGCYHGIPAGRRDAYRAEVAAVTRPGGDLYLAGVSHPPATWRLLGAPGLEAGDLRRRFGADFDLVGEQTAGPVGRAGKFVLFHLVRKSPRAARADLFSGRAVEALPDQVGVPVVPRVLLDHVRHDPAQRDIAAPPEAPDVEGRRRGHERPRVVALGPPEPEGLGHVGGGHVAPRRLPVQVGREDPGHLLAARHRPEPVALHLGHVPDQAQQGNAGGRNGPLPQLIVVGHHGQAPAGGGG